MTIRFVLHRPRSSQNIGAAARALANTGAGALWVVEPLGFDRAQAAKLAAGADGVLEAMRVVRTLDEALDECVEVVMTTGRETPGALPPREAAARLLGAPGPAALVFGDEVRGLTNRDLRRAHALTTIPTAQKSSLNLAPAEPLAEERLLALLRERARTLLLECGFLNPQQPDLVLDEMVSLLRRARPTKREAELALAAIAQLMRTQAR